MSQLQGFTYGLVERSGDKFRLQHQRLLVTYPVHIEADLLRTCFSSFDKYPLTSFAVFYEASEVGCLTHVLVEFERRFASNNRKIFDFHIAHPIIRTFRSEKELNAAKAHLESINVPSPIVNQMPAESEPDNIRQDINELLDDLPQMKPALQQFLDFWESDPSTMMHLWPLFLEMMTLQQNTEAVTLLWPKCVTLITQHRTAPAVKPRSRKIIRPPPPLVNNSTVYTQCSLGRVPTDPLFGT